MFTHSDRKNMLINELYTLRSLLTEDTLEEAKNKLKELTELVINAPVSDAQSNLPRIKARRG